MNQKTSPNNLLRIATIFSAILFRRPQTVSRAEGDGFNLKVHTPERTRRNLFAAFKGDRAIISVEGIHPDLRGIEIHYRKVEL